MSRKNTDKYRLCCACLSNSLDLEYMEVTTKDEDKVDILTKLHCSIPEIKWEPSFYICLSCANLLKTSYEFRNTCLKSEEIRHKQVLKDSGSKKGTHQTKTNKNARSKINHENTKNEEIICKEEPKELKEEGSINNDQIIDQENSEFDNERSNDTDFTETENEDSNDEDCDNYSDKKEDKTRQSKKTGLLQVRIVKNHRPKHIYTFSCEKCSFIARSVSIFVNHCTDEHDMVTKDVKPFQCNRCPSKFNNSSNLLQHQKYHKGVRSNVCSYCGKGFITKTDLRTHEKHHLNKREYNCEECGKCYNTHKDVRSHILVVHTDSSKWKHVCEICNKRFPIKSNYDSHMRRHIGEKKFECHLCHRKFTDKCVLQRHMKTHSNVREFRCSECSKEYKDHRVMRIHMAKIHQIGVDEIKLPSKERKYQCHICPKAYYAKNKLTRHLYTHTGEKPYSCSICSKNFNDKSYVKQHLKKTHGIESDIGDNIKWEVLQAQ